LSYAEVQVLSTADLGKIQTRQPVFMQTLLRAQHKKVQKLQYFKQIFKQRVNLMPRAKRSDATLNYYNTYEPL